VIPSRVTLVGLIQLVVQFPQLSSLGVVVDATDLDHSLETRPGRGIFNPKTMSLQVGSSPIRNAANAAAFLLAILPNVLQLDHGWTTGAWGRKVWLASRLGIKLPVISLYLNLVVDGSQSVFKGGLGGMG
jgi:hypothetical protein